MSVPVLSNATLGKVDDCSGDILGAVLVDSTVVGPESGKLKDTKEDTQDVHSGLHVVLSLDEAQELQAVKGSRGKEAPPNSPKSSAIDGVNDIVIVPPTDAAVRILPASVPGVPSMETRPEKANKNTRGDMRGDDPEVPNPSLTPDLVFSSLTTVIVLEMLGKFVRNAHPHSSGCPDTAAMKPVLIDGKVSIGLDATTGLPAVRLHRSCVRTKKVRLRRIERSSSSTA
jgi:hypothetical protein